MIFVNSPSIACWKLRRISWTGPGILDPIERSEREAGPPPSEIADAVAAELLHIHHESYGGTAQAAKSPDREPSR
jgi:hypothetical protein